MISKFFIKRLGKILSRSPLPSMLYFANEKFFQSLKNAFCTNHLAVFTRFSNGSIIQKNFEINCLYVSKGVKRETEEWSGGRQKENDWKPALISVQFFFFCLFLQFSSKYATTKFAFQISIVSKKTAQTIAYTTSSSRKMKGKRDVVKSDFHGGTNIYGVTTPSFANNNAQKLFPRQEGRTKTIGCLSSNAKMNWLIALDRGTDKI